MTSREGILPDGVGEETPAEANGNAEVSPEALAAVAESAGDASVEAEVVVPPEETPPEEPSSEPTPEPIRITGKPKTQEEIDAELRASGEGEPNDNADVDNSGNNIGNPVKEAGKGRIERAFDWAYRTRGIRDFVSKYTLRYREGEISKQEDQIIRLKGEVSGLDSSLRLLDREKAKLERGLATARGRNDGSAEELQKELKDIEREQAEILKEKDELLSGIEMSVNWLAGETNARDRIVDRVLAAYEEEFAPIDMNLERAREGRSHINLIESVAEARWEELEAELAGQEAELSEWIEGMRSRGKSERDISKNSTVIRMKGSIERGKSAIREEREVIQAKKLKLDKEITRYDAQAAPYRDKFDELKRIKQARPIRTKSPERTEVPNFTDGEKIVVHTRKPAEGGAIRGEDLGSESSEPGAEVNEVIDTRPTVSDYINKVNEQLSKDPEAGDARIDSKELLRSTGLDETTKFNPGRVKTILNQYLIYKGITSSAVIKAVNEAIE